MKYYAVTEDPNELLHYGVKGMKWGQHLFGDDLRPKSQGYKRAVKKLKSVVNKAKNSVVKTSTQRAIDRQKKQQAKFEKAAKDAQRRIAITENLHTVDQMKAFERSNERAYKNELKVSRAADRQERKYAKNERKMQKYTQQARENRLRYGKLSDEQVGRIQERLAIEEGARRLGGKENPKFRTRMKTALQEGILQGVAQGTAAGMKEVAVAKVQNKLKNKRVLDKQSEQKAERDKKASRIKNQKTRKEMRQDLKQEAAEAEIREGIGWDNRHTFFTAKSAAKTLQNIKGAEHERQRVQGVQDKIANERDENWQKLLGEYNTTDKALRTRLYGKAAKTGDANQQRQQILANDKSIKDQMENSKNKSAVQKYLEYQSKQREADRIEASNAEKEKRYQRRIEAWEKQPKATRGPKPKRRKDETLESVPFVPSLDYDTIQRVDASGVLKLYGNNGGGKKK